jgi:hypothetical protein
MALCRHFRVWREQEHEEVKTMTIKSSLSFFFHMSDKGKRKIKYEDDISMPSIFVFERSQNKRRRRRW